MLDTRSVGARILAAQAHHCEQMAADLAAAQTAGASAEVIADLEAQELAARKRYQELAADLPSAQQSRSVRRFTEKRRPWWRLW